MISAIAAVARTKMGKLSDYQPRLGYPHELRPVHALCEDGSGVGEACS